MYECMYGGRPKKKEKENWNEDLDLRKRDLHVGGVKTRGMMYRDVLVRKYRKRVKHLVMWAKDAGAGYFVNEYMI